MASEQIWNVEPPRAVANQTEPGTSELKKTDGETFACSICSKRFPTRTRTACHEKTHSTDRAHKCSLCKYACTNKHYLKSHMMVHTKEKPFHCNLCETSFAQLTSLTYHIRSHTGVRPYQCKICSKVFDRTFALKTHMLNHDGIKPFTCSIAGCGKAFTVDSGRRSHEKIHYKEKKYSCHKCGSRFIYKTAMGMHKCEDGKTDPNDNCS